MPRRSIRAQSVLEYAVVHELLRERNHDEAFWRLVGTLLPDQERRNAWLDQNEGFLTLRRIEPTRSDHGAEVSVRPEPVTFGVPFHLELWGAMTPLSSQAFAP